jgi:hypothetical protein
MNFFFTVVVVVVVRCFFFHFCKVGGLVDHTQEDLAKFGYLSDRKLDFFLGDNAIH